MGPKDRLNRMGGGLALGGEVGGDHHLPEASIGGHTGQKTLEVNLVWTNPVERREPAHEHEVAALKRLRLLQDQEVGSGLHNTEQCGVTALVLAGLAGGLLCEVVAPLAGLESLGCLEQGPTQQGCARSIVLHQVQGHALRSFGPHPWDARKCVCQCQ